MKKVLIPILALILALGLALPMAAASPSSPAWVELETLSVDSQSNTPTTSSTTLIDGWLYRFEASGTYSAGAGITADAEYSSGPPSYLWQEPVEGYEGYGVNLLDLKVDDTFVDWGDYSSSHVYTMDYVGKGSTVDFQIYDIHYPSNSGSLSVKIFATPVMVSTAIISGESTVGVGAEESWDIEITVEAKYADVCDVVVQDGMGADLDDIVLVSNTTGEVAIGEKTVGQGKHKMRATMVTWTVGNLAAGGTETLVVTVTTGFNSPRNHRFQPKHEFTSAELGHELDGGASATYTLCATTEYKSPESDPLTVDVEDPPSLYLYEKETTNWVIKEDGAWGVMEYNFQGPTFDFYFEGYDLAATTNYSLIYYADPWPGDHPGYLLGTGISDGDGDITISDSIDFGHHLPHPNDANDDGAKIWLIPSSYYDSVTNEVTGWPAAGNEPPAGWLFEHNLINYYDTHD